MSKIFRIIVIVCLLCFNLFAQDKKTEVDALKVLILGGTTFLGPHLTNELLSHGHKVTHFSRGNEHFLSFPEVEKLQGDRDGNLKALEGRKWDAIIDTSGYLPRVVEASSKILAGAASHYTFISTISVYDDFKRLHIDENSPLAKLDDNSDEKITEKTYGPFKVGCEKVIKAYFPDNSLIIRPGLIVGPYDPTDRFTFWVRRIAEGGKVLIPNTPKQKLQFIDVRDLAKWIVKMVEERAVGTYNATGPKEELNFEKFINECSKFSKKKLDLIWVDEKFLIDHHFDNWNKLPLWLSSKSDMAGLFCIDSHKAQDKGLSYRPISETISATLNWDDKRINRKMKIGLSREEESNLLNQISEEQKK
jgi:2'-hydroxyisoflavone reductase